MDSPRTYSATTNEFLSPSTKFSTLKLIDSKISFAARFSERDTHKLNAGTVADSMQYIPRINSNTQALNMSTNVGGVFRIPERRWNLYMNSSQQNRKKHTAAKNVACPTMLISLAVRRPESAGSRELNPLVKSEPPVITTEFAATGR